MKSMPSCPTKLACSGVVSPQILIRVTGFLFRPASAAWLRDRRGRPLDRRKQSCRLANVAAAHERLTHKYRVEPSSGEPLDILSRMNAAFADRHPARRNSPAEAKRYVK